MHPKRPPWLTVMKTLKLYSLNNYAVLASERLLRFFRALIRVFTMRWRVTDKKKSDTINIDPTTLLNLQWTGFFTVCSARYGAALPSPVGNALPGGCSKRLSPVWQWQQRANAREPLITDNKIKLFVDAHLLPIIRPTVVTIETERPFRLANETGGMGMKIQLHPSPIERHRAPVNGLQLRYVCASGILDQWLSIVTIWKKTFYVFSVLINRSINELPKRLQSV